MKFDLHFGVHCHYQHFDDRQSVVSGIDPYFAIETDVFAIFFGGHWNGDFFRDTRDGQRAFDILLAAAVLPLAGHFPRTTGVLCGVQPREHFFIAICFVRIEVGKIPRHLRRYRRECGIIARY